MNRRFFVKFVAALPSITCLPNTARSLPILSKNNYGLTHDHAVRMNGWAEIDTTAFHQNIQVLRKKIGSVPLCVVIKGNAYGHGLDLLMPTIVQSNCTILGFASNEEARIAREFNYDGRLVRIRSATTEEISDATKYNVEELIGGMNLSEQVNAIARSKNIKIKTHWMLNSAGMGRNGLDVSTQAGKNEAKKIVESLTSINIVGISTHFPVENQIEVRNRLASFQVDCSWIFSNTALQRNDIALHAANSYATLNVPESRLDMVRCGACLYDSILGERQVMSPRSRVATVLSYPKGSTISYDSTYVLERDSRIANIPVGYSDGFRRAFSFSNVRAGSDVRPFVLIAGHKAPVLGRITMNTLLADVTDFPDVKINDDVVFMGHAGDDRISWADWVKWSEAGLYELATLLGNSIPKVVVPEY